MHLNKLPLSLIFLFNIIGSGFFYAQNIPIKYTCPRGDSLHRGFICQCSAPKSLTDSIILKHIQFQEKYCPRGIHNFICQCAPASYYQDQKLMVVKKQKKFKRKSKSSRLKE